MKVEKKYIGINQRVPFQVLDDSLFHYLESCSINKSLIIEHLSEFTKGKNRAEKAASYVCQILQRQNKNIGLLFNAVSSTHYLKLPENERKALFLCLLSLTFPITYDLLIALASGFKSQDVINRKFINNKLASIYGSNRTLDIGIDALVPMIIELGTIQRVKTSLYTKNKPMLINNNILKEFIVYTDISLSGSKSILVDEIKHRPWYSFFEINLKIRKEMKFIKYTEGRIGEGYLTIN